MMADTWGRLTGEPGICMVTRGPGATNASGGAAHRRQDSIPMILFIGQVQRDARERGGLPGSRVPPRLDRIQPNGSARSTMLPASRNSSPAPLRSPHPAAPAPWYCHCPRTCCAMRSRRPRQAPFARRSRIPDAARSTTLPATAEGRAADGHPRRHALGCGCSGRFPRPSPSASTCRSAAPSAARCCSTICILDLCRRCRHRHQSCARQRDQGERPADPARQPHVGNAVIRATR